MDTTWSTQQTMNVLRYAYTYAHTRCQESRLYISVWLWCKCRGSEKEFTQSVRRDVHKRKAKKKRKRFATRSKVMMWCGQIEETREGAKARLKKQQTSNAKMMLFSICDRDAFDACTHLYRILINCCGHCFLVDSMNSFLSLFFLSLDHLSTSIVVSIATPHNEIFDRSCHTWIFFRNRKLHEMRENTYENTLENGNLFVSYFVLALRCAVISEQWSK